MKLIHFSSKPLTAVQTIPKRKRGDMRGQRSIGMKPDGLWVSDESEDSRIGWKEWCESGRFHCESYTYATPIEVRPERLMIIRSVRALDAFNAVYGGQLAPGLRSEYIDWQKVGSDCDGIIITPYFWERRLRGPIWYYGWDCASGCIWSKRAIKALGESYPVVFNERKYNDD